RTGRGVDDHSHDRGGSRRSPLGRERYLWRRDVPSPLAHRAAHNDVRRARLLRVALGFLDLQPREPEPQLLHRCFDTWRGIGDVVAGMARQEYDLELRRYNGRGWRAMFFESGFEHSLTSHAGAAWARSPWEAVQRAAADALRQRESPDPPA